MNKKQFNAKSFHKVVFVLMGGAFFVILGVSLASFLILNNLSKEMANNHFQVVSNNKKIEKLSTLKSKVRSLESEKEEIDSYFPSKKEVDDLIIGLEEESRKRNLEFKLMENQVVKKRTANSQKDFQVESLGDYSVYKFKIEVIGEYPNVAKFIEDIENYERIVQIERLSYSAEKTPGSIKSELFINIYMK